MRHIQARYMLPLASVAAVLAAVCAAPSGQAAAAHPAGLSSNAPVTVVASGLNSPRGLTWGPNGHILVAESGTVGSECVDTNCYGLTGSIADVSSGTPVRIVSGLASATYEGEPGGPEDVAYANGHLYALVGQSRAGVPSGLSTGLTAALDQQLGAVLDVTGGKVSVFANPGNSDYNWTEQHLNLADDYPFANPYALIPKPGGGFYLADAGANLLDSVDSHGYVRQLAFIPLSPAGSDSVPTCLALGPGGVIYLSQLTGAGNNATAASIYRYVPATGSLTVWQTGFSAVTGCGFGVQGDFYVTEFDTTGFPPSGAPDGAVIQISPNGTRTTLGAGQLFAPDGFLAGADGSIYVSNNTTSVATDSPPGEVVKIG
jgi:hypothetical protein